MKPGRIGGFVLLAIASLLADCAADSSLLEQLVAVPGYYDTLDCPALIEQLRSSTKRVRELILLMEKSGQDSTGAIVNAVAYNTEYAKARVAQKQAEEAAVLCQTSGTWLPFLRNEPNSRFLSAAELMRYGISAGSLA